MKQTTRREFIRRAAIAGTGAMLAPGLLGRAWAAEVQGPTVVWAAGAGASPARLIRAAVESLGGMKSFVGAGARVVLKPNIGWDRGVDFAANTHPELVTEAARMCLEAGAARVLIFDRSCNDPRRCYINSGIQPAVEALRDRRVAIPHIDERLFRQVPIPGGKVITTWQFYGEALDADVYINMPIAKHHAASALTLSLKNTMGVLGGNRGALHRDLQGYLADINKVIRPRLIIMDATRILVANGPQGGNLADVRRPGVIIAGTDPVAVDSVSCGLFNRAPRDVPHIPRAQEEGLGVADLDRINLRKLTV